MLCFHVIIASMLFSSGACQGEVSVLRRRKLLILSFCPFPQPNEQRQGEGSGAENCSILVCCVHRKKTSLQSNVHADH